jgi:alpha 1,2-mannosyltransferase
MNPTFVYLAQNTSKDPQWGRDSRSMLEVSLDKLYQNYNDRYHQSVIIFHEGDFSEDDQVAIIKGRREVTFHQIEFKIPDFLDPSLVPDVWVSSAGKAYGEWGLGHRHMCRFYTLQVFDILSDLGFDWVCRFDDDSILHSPINYDIFEYMQRNSLEYGYRVDSQEPYRLTEGFSNALHNYIDENSVKPTFFDEHIWQPNWIDESRNLMYQLLSIRFPLMKNHLKNRGTYNNWGYFNNFFISKLSFWKSEPVQHFLHHFDQMGANHIYRWNDLVLQSAAVQIFMPKEKVHKFEDWTYEHATIRNGILEYGGIWQGNEDQEAKAVKDFVERYGKAVFDLEKTF